MSEQQPNQRKNLKCRFCGKGFTLTPANASILTYSHSLHALCSNLRSTCDHCGKCYHSFVPWNQLEPLIASNGLKHYPQVFVDDAVFLEYLASINKEFPQEKALSHDDQRELDRFRWQLENDDMEILYQWK